MVTAWLVVGSILVWIAIVTAVALLLLILMQANGPSTPMEKLDEEMEARMGHLYQKEK